MRDLALGIDEHGPPDHAEALLAVEVLLAPRAVFLDHHMLGIREQPDGKRSLLDELLVARGRVRAAPEHRRLESFEGREPRGEVTSLRRAAGGIVLRIEIEHHPATLEVGEFHRLFVLVFQRKCRGFLPDLELYLRLRHPSFLQQNRGGPYAAPLWR